MIDLHHVAGWAKHSDHSADQCKAGDDMMLRLIIELLAARRVVAAVEGLGAIMAGADSEEWVIVVAALEHYNEILKSGGPSADTGTSSTTTN